jgi:PTH1 family peptidyl-tRNA hydrolase
LVVCDDLNLPLGSVRLRPRGSSGGQNGLASVIEYLGGDEFPRLRLGVAPRGGEVDPADWPDYVLADFEPEEAPSADELVSYASDALEFWLENGLEATISRFNRRIKPKSDPAQD